MELCFEVIARGIIFDETASKILFCATKSKSHYYLVGGHVEYWERAKSALSRECLEEMGLEIAIADWDFRGANENIYEDIEGKHHEINLYFQYGGKPLSIIESKEEHIIFEWLDRKELDAYPILPHTLPALIEGWVHNKIQWMDIK